MGIEVGSSLRPRDPVAQLPSPHGQTTISPSGRVDPVRHTFDEVLTRYRDAIYRYALHLTGNRVAADELYQKTVFKAHDEFHRLDGSANHCAWLYRIATNAFLSSHRRRSKEDSLMQESVELGRATAVQPEAPGLLAEVAAFLANLPVRQRLALIQRMYHDLSYTEIAASLRCSEVGARTSVHQALRTLGDHFGERL
jgi:RNA polymerase sigma-70 factor (ECF subfamily)